MDRPVLASDMDVVAHLLVVPPISSPPPVPPIKSTDVPPTPDPVAPTPDPVAPPADTSMGAIAPGVLSSLQGLESLAELVGGAPLILIGEVGPVHQYLDFAVYGEDGQLLERGVGPDGVLLPEAPATDFILIVEDVIRDDGIVARGEPIILRMPGHATEELKELTRQTAFPFVFTGDRQLFLLTLNLDGASYVLYHGPWHQLIIDGEILRIAGGEQPALHFADDPNPVTLEEFIQFVESQ